MKINPWDSGEDGNWFGLIQGKAPRNGNRARLKRLVKFALWAKKDDMIDEGNLIINKESNYLEFLMNGAPSWIRPVN